jgi:nucleotide-binding universal stress UspA family protein
MKKVVVAIDGSETSRAVVDYALYYANREIDVKIVFFHVIEPYKSLWRSVAMKPYEDLMAAVEVSFKRFVEEEMDKIPVDREKMSLVTRLGVPYVEVVRFAEEEEADIIMIGHRSTFTGMERFLVGSVAAKVVAHAPCSVFVHRPRPDKVVVAPIPADF